MDDNNDQADMCTKIRTAFESACPELWVSFASFCN